MPQALQTAGVIIAHGIWPCCVWFRRNKSAYKITASFFIKNSSSSREEEERDSRVFMYITAILDESAGSTSHLNHPDRDKMFNCILRRKLFLTLILLHGTSTTRPSLLRLGGTYSSWVLKTCGGLDTRFMFLRFFLLQFWEISTQNMHKSFFRCISVLKIPVSYKNFGKRYSKPTRKPSVTAFGELSCRWRFSLF